MTEDPRLTLKQAASLVDAATAGTDDEYDVSVRLSRSFKSWLDLEEQSEESGPARWTLWAFEFHARGAAGDEEHFRPQMIYSDGSASSPHLRDLPDQCLAWYEELAEVVTVQSAQARLEHILFLRRHGNAGSHARLAARGYLAEASGTDRRLYAADFVRNALQLARATRDSNLADQALAQAARLAGECLHEENPPVGILLRFLEILVGEDDKQYDATGLFGQARSKYTGQPHAEDSTIELQIQHAKGNSTLVELLRTERVDVWIAAADVAEPLVAVAYLQRAIEFARRSNNRPLIERATAKLQAMRLEEMGFATFSVDSMRPRGELERLLRPITEATTWQDALTAFSMLGPIIGDHAANQRAVNERASQFVFSQLFPPMLLGGDNLPRYQPESEDELHDYRVARDEVLAMQLHGGIVLEALVRIIATNPLPSLHDLATHFLTAPHIDTQLATAIGRSFQRFWAGDTEGAAFTIVPRIEALARNLLLMSNVGIYRTQRQQRPGQYPPLRFLLDQLLTMGMDESWHRMIHLLCTHVAGLNYRNELAHGFVDGNDEGIVALLLQAAAHLASYRPRTSNDDSADDC